MIITTAAQHMAQNSSKEEGNELLSIAAANVLAIIVRFEVCGNLVNNCGGLLEGHTTTLLRMCQATIAHAQ